MYRHYEQRHERTSPRDYDRNDDTCEILSPTTYRSAMTPRQTHIQRSRPTGLNAPGVSTRIYQSYLSTATTGHFGPGLTSLVNFPGVPLRRGSNSVNTAVVNINTARQRDKRDLEILNDKFAQYVEKVRFLEAHNRKLALEGDVLRNRPKQGTSRVKEMYDIEMNEATKLIDDMKRDATTKHAKKQQAEQELNNQIARYNEIKDSRDGDRREIDSIQLQISENEAQIALFRRRMADLEDESGRYKVQAQRLSSEVAHLQNQIQNELFLKSTCEIEKLGLEDNLTNLKQLHESDLAELRSKSVTNDLDPSQFFRNELSEAIREIRNDYENEVDHRRNDLQNRYSLLMNEIIIRTQQHDANPLLNEQQRRQVDHLRHDLSQTQNQNGYLRDKNRQMENSIEDLKQKIKDLNDRDALAKAEAEREMNEARRKLDRVEHTYADVTTFKTNLEKEIAIYRELLESPNGLRGCADRIVQNAEQKAPERPISANYLFNDNRSRPGSAKTTTFSRTHINTLQSSNYVYVEPAISSTVRNSTDKRPPSSSYYQTLSNTNRYIPAPDETNHNNPSWETTARDYNLRDSIIQDSGLRDNENRGGSVRHSRSSSGETLIRVTTDSDNPQSPEYETYLDN